MVWKPDLDEEGNCRNNPCEYCNGKPKGEDGTLYSCDNCPIL